MKLGNFQENYLYNKIKQKDKDAFIKAYDLYLDNIYRFIFFKVGDAAEAEDITSQTFLKTWDYIQNNQISDYKTLKALLYRVARNLVIDHYRKKSTQSEVSLENEYETVTEIKDKAQDVHGEVESQIDFKLLEKKLFQLKDEYREVILMKYINQLSISEIAEILNKSKGNIRVIAYRALKALKDIAQDK